MLLHPGALRQATCSGNTDLSSTWRWRGLVDCMVSLQLLLVPALRL